MLADDSGATLLQINGTFWVELIAFLITLAILAKWAFPAIMREAEKRQNAISEALRAAEENRAESLKALEAARKDLDDVREQAREILDRARKEAAAEADEARARGRADAAAIAEKAKADIGVERDRAIQELRSQVATLVVATAGKVLGESIDAKAHTRLIDESLAKITPEQGGKG
jgi:F-type H+-transporting ATPase subunit b